MNFEGFFSLILKANKRVRILTDLEVAFPKQNPNSLFLQVNYNTDLQTKILTDLEVAFPKQNPNSLFLQVNYSTDLQKSHDCLPFNISSSPHVTNFSLFDTK